MRLLRRALVALSALALARSASASDRAEQLFREARAAMKDKDYATACPKFEESQRLEPAPGTLTNLADCEEHLGRVVQARDDYALAATGFPRDDPRRAFVLERARTLEAQFAHLTLRARDLPATAIVRRALAQVGGTVVSPSTFGVKTDVDPGPTKIVVTAPGRQDRVYDLTLEPGSTQELEITVGEPTPVVTKVKTVLVEAKPRSNVARTLGFVGMSVGVVGAATGVVTGLLAMSRASTVKAHCTPELHCDQIGFNAASEGKVLAPLSTAAIIAGGALFAVAATVVIWSFTRRKDIAFESNLLLTF